MAQQASIDDYQNLSKASLFTKLQDQFDFLEPKEIKDPDASKPADWVEQAKIPDPDVVKPEGYDDIPAEIPDPEAKKPDDWDDEMDGEWEPPQIDNPEYKGEWKANNQLDGHYVCFDNRSENQAHVIFEIILVSDWLDEEEENKVIDYRAVVKFSSLLTITFTLGKNSKSRHNICHDGLAMKSPTYRN